MSFAQQQWGLLVDDCRRDVEKREIETVLNQAGMTARQWQQNAEAWEKRTLTAEKQAMGSLAVRSALETLVRSVYPNHPILEKTLREKVFAAGVHAGEFGNSYKAALDAGATFALPATVPQLSTTEAELRVQLAEAKRKVAELEEKLATSVQIARQEHEDAEEKLAYTIRDCVRHLALSSAYRQVVETTEPSHPLLVDSALRGRITAEAYSQLVANGGSDWDVVRQTGHAWEASARRAAAAVSGPSAAARAAARDPLKELTA